MTAPIVRIRDGFADLLERTQTRPLDYMQWLPPQDRWHRCDASIKLYRAGNQALGKTTAGLAEVIWRCTGTHPHLETKTPGPGFEAWIICASWQQSLAVQRKLWDLLPKDLIKPGTRCDPVNGFHANAPTVQFKNGALIRFKTTRQGGLQLSSASIDVAMFDEPPASPRIFQEVLKRVMAAGKAGVVLMTLTPINAPTDWLQAVTVPSEDGRPPMVTDMHARLTVDNLIPLGSNRPLALRDGTLCDAEWIDQIIRETLPHEVPVVVHGEWEMRVEGNLFSSFKATGVGAHVTTDLPAGEVELQLGIDHGSGANFSQYAVLVAIERNLRGGDRIWVLDEYVSSGETSEDADAEAIVALVERYAPKGWKQLDRVYGDRPWSMANRRLQRKSNRQLAKAIARRLKIDPDRLSPGIRTVKRGKGHGAGSVHVGCQYLHRAMIDDRFHIHPTCNRLILSLQRWDYRDNEWKHAIDGLRYACDNRVFLGQKSSDATVFVY